MTSFVIHHFVLYLTHNSAARLENGSLLSPSFSTKPRHNSYRSNIQNLPLRPFSTDPSQKTSLQEPALNFSSPFLQLRAGPVVAGKVGERAADW